MSRAEVFRVSVALYVVDGQALKYCCQTNGEGGLTSSTMGQSHGWSYTAKIVRELDEQRVQDYKEDIDTLLVFVRISSYSITVNT